MHGAWNSGDGHAPGGPVDAVLPELRPVLRDRCAAALRSDCEHETGEILCVVFGVVLYEIIRFVFCYQLCVTGMLRRVETKAVCASLLYGKKSDEFLNKSNK